MKTKEIEVWVDCPVFPEQYMVSSAGRIMTKQIYVRTKGDGLRLVPERIRKLIKHPGGRIQITLCRDQERVQCRVHRLVAMAFVPGDHSTEVNHIDGNPENNSASNLEWATRQENLEHAKKHRLFPSGKDHYAARISEETALAVITLINAGVGFPEIAKKIGISRTHPRHIAKGTAWKHLNHLVDSTIKEKLFSKAQP